MSAPEQRQPFGISLLMIAAVLITLVLAIEFVRWAPSATRLPSPAGESSGGLSGAGLQIEAPRYGVSGKLSAAGIAVQRTLPAMAFALQPGQSLDARLPAGPFRGEFTVTFASEGVRAARFGAQIQGGSIILLMRGHDRPLLSDAAGDQPRTALTVEYVPTSRLPQQLTYIFETNGKKPARLRALWQPEESDLPLALPSDGAVLVDDNSLQGMVLAQEFNCAACHVSSDSQLQAQLAVGPGPLLGEIGARARPNWIRAWLSDPQALFDGTPMPQLFHGEPMDHEKIEDLTHFLVSMGGPMDFSVGGLPDPDNISTGMVNYHTLGCVACHGPQEPLEKLPGARASIGFVAKSYTPLGALASKTTAGQLAEFLRNPVKFHPSGRMPAQNLDDLEAESIASYLVARNMQRHAIEKESFSIDPQRVNRGRLLFASSGCANCHGLGPDRSPITATLHAPALESLSGSGLGRGCLAANVLSREGGSPRFTLNDAQRTALTTFLQGLSDRKCDDVPPDRLAATMTRLNCMACHQYQGEPGPEPAIAQYFVTIAEADLGDEGRVPPNLSDVGGELNPLWFDQVLAEQGRARPYMGARMPQFGQANIQYLAKDLTSAAGVWFEPDHGPATDADDAAIGHVLVGSKGLNCIQCHTIAGHDATGTPGPDLAKMPERLRYDAFSRWVHDPKLERPGTRMPSFFVNGRGGFTQYLGGDADRQVDAIWAYLWRGDFLQLPLWTAPDSAMLKAIFNDPMPAATLNVIPNQATAVKD